MKLVIGMILFVVFFISCGKEVKKGKYNVKDFVGEWVYKSYKIDNRWDQLEDVYETYNDTIRLDSNGEANLRQTILNEDGTVWYYIKSNKGSWKYIDENDSLIINIKSKHVDTLGNEKESKYYNLRGKIEEFSSKLILERFNFDYSPGYRETFVLEKVK